MIKKIGKLSLLCGVASSLCASEVSVNGFLTTGMAVHNTGSIEMGELRASAAGSLEYFVNEDFEPKYDGFIGSRPDFLYDSLVGIQLDSFLSDKWSATVQLMSEGQKDFKTEATWVFVKYNAKDNLSFRAGKLRFPAFLMSEYLQVGHTFPWVRPPREIYQQIPSGLSNYLGVDMLYNKSFGGFDLSLALFYGGGNPELTIAGSTIKLPTRNAVGINVLFGNEELTIRAGYAQGQFSLNPLPDSVKGLQGASRTFGKGESEGDLWNWVDKKGRFMGVGAVWDTELVYAATEVTRRLLKGWLTGTYGWYVAGGMRFGKWLPTVTFARHRSTDPHKIMDLTGHGNALETAANLVDSLKAGVNAGAKTQLDAFAADTNANNKAVYNYLQDRLYDTYNRPQDAFTFAVKYDLASEVVVKGSVEYIQPKKNGQGRYPGLMINADMKGKSVKMYSLAVNVLF